MALDNSRRIHLMKTATWRLVASVATFVIGWSVTGDLAVGLTIGIVDAAIKTLLYYGHERLWFRYAQNRSVRG